MKIAEKIITLRKQAGLSQEELADKVFVSRQAVSKWESEQAVPDIDKIVILSEIFGVSTDYLLKDDEVCATSQKELIKTVTEAETNGFMKDKKKTALLSALGVALCILSPIALIILAGASSVALVDDTLSTVMGLITIFVFVGVAVAMFIYSGYALSHYGFMEKPFILSLSLKNQITTDKQAFKKTYYIVNALSACACVLSPLPIILSSFNQDPFLATVMVGITLFIIAIAVFGFVIVGTVMGGYDKLLKEGDYSEAKTKRNAFIEKISSVFWLVVVAVFLAWGFIGNAWGTAWIVFPIGGVLFTIFEIVVGNAIEKK